MADLTLSEESKQFQQLARDFAQNEISPKAEQLDHSGEFPQDIYESAWELGLLTAFLPEKFGGLGLSLLDACVISEELATGCSGVVAALEGNALCAAPLMVAGNSPQQEKYLSKLTAACSFAGFCFDQPQTSAESTPVACYVKEGNDYEINANDLLCLNAGRAGWYFLIAQSSKTGRTSAFILEPETPGLSSLPAPYKLGRRCSDLGRVQLKNVRINKDQLIGEEGEWHKLASSISCYSAPIIASHAVGIAQSACNNSVTYAKERFAFGKPIASNQGVSFMLADMAKNSRAARLLTHHAAWLTDQGKPDQTQALTALSFALDGAMSAATNAVQVYGGYGYSREYPVEKLMRDAKTMQMLFAYGLKNKVSIGRELVGLR